MARKKAVSRVDLEREHTRVLADIYDKYVINNPDYVYVKRIYKWMLSPRMILHTGMFYFSAIEHLQKYKLKKMHFLTLIYLATTPAATKYEIRAYLKMLWGYDFGIGKPTRFDVKKLLNGGFIKRVPMPKLFKGQLAYMITKEGKDAIRPLMDTSIVRSVVNMYKWETSHSSKERRKYKKQQIKNHYPEMKDWRKL